MAVQILIAMDRADLAAKKHATMQKVDDDATITLLAGAWVALAQGGDAVSDAVQSFQELAERFGGSLPLLNGHASALMLQGKVSEAEKKFIDAIGMVGVAAVPACAGTRRFLTAHVVAHAAFSMTGRERPRHTD